MRTVPIKINADLGGGLFTIPNLLAVPANATPNCMDVKFGVDGSVEKRAGSTTTNSVAIITGAATGFTPDSGGTLSTNLATFWKLTEQTGTRADEFSSTNLSDINSVSYHTGVLGNAALFVAANSNYLLVADTATVSVGAVDFTLNTWVYLNSKTADQTLISKWSMADTSNREYRIAYDAQQDRFYAQVRSGNVEKILLADSIGVVSTSTWYMLQLKHDSAGGVLYFGGGTQAFNSVAFAGPINDAGAPFLVGAAATSPAFQMDSGGNLLAGLKAYWRMEEASGTRVDATTRGNDLSDINSTGVTTGRVDSAASFVMANSNHLRRDGSSADLQCDPSHDFTISAWVRLTDTANSYAIVAKGTSATQSEYLLYYRKPSAVFQFFVQDTAGNDRPANSSVTPLAATNYHIIAWYDSANRTSNIVVNNGAINSASAADITLTATTADFYIGKAPTAIAEHLNGFGDEVGVWHRLLTAAERTDLYRSTSGSRFSTDYASARVDETGIWKKALTAQERKDLYNGNTANTYSKGASSSGFGSFDFGASALRWHVVSAGTGVYASSNRGVSYVAIATDRSAAYQEFERSKNFLIAVSDSYNRVLYWAGSVGTVMIGMPLGSANAVKHAMDFNGYTFLMNGSGGNKRIVQYNDNNTFTTGPFSSTFEVASSADDEITGGTKYGSRAYIFTRYTTHQITPVGGNPDFAVRQVKDWGAVPRTIKRATYKDLGEVIICLGYDKKLRVFDGADEQIISSNVEQNNTIAATYLNGLATDHIQKCHAEVDTVEQVYKLWIVMTPSTEVTHQLNLNLRTGAFYPYHIPQVNTAVMAESGNSRVLLQVKQDGFVYQADTLNTDSGVAIDEVYDTPLYTGSAGMTVTKQHKLALYFAPTSSGTVYIQDAKNFTRAFTTPPRDSVMLTGASSVIQVKKVMDLPVTDNTIQFRITSSGASLSTAEPWRLNRMEIAGETMGQGQG